MRPLRRSYTRRPLPTTLTPPSGGAAEMRHRAQLAQPRDDLLASQALHALGTELLDVERGQDRRVSHRPAQQLVAEPAGAVGRDVAHEAAGERIAGAGGIDHGLERVRGQREEALARD